MKRLNRWPAAFTSPFLSMTPSTAGAADVSDLDAAMAALATYQYGMSRAPLVLIEAQIRESNDNPELRKAIERRLIELLAAQAPLDAKQFACRQLYVIGAEDAVPALAALLSNPKTVDMACYALAPNPAAGPALRNALNTLEGAVRIPIINLLGERRDTQAVDALARFAAEEDAPVAEAAITALGKIGTREAASTLTEVRAKDDPRRRLAAAHALLECAQRLADYGDRESAEVFLKELAAATNPDVISQAARKALEAR